jgi:hypothetical protein
MGKREPKPAAKTAPLPEWPTIEKVAKAAANLANHIREHLPIKGDPAPPSGGPTGTAHDPATTGLLITRSALQLALLALNERTKPKPATYILAGEDAIQRDQAIRRIQMGYEQISRCYGFDRLDAGESVEEQIPEIDPIPVRYLEWGANKLMGAVMPNEIEKDDWKNRNHSFDFTQVWWDGEPYHFGKSEVRCMAVLWRAWAAHTPAVRGEAVVKEAIDKFSGRTLAQIFRGNKAWGKLILAVKGIKGAYCLNDPSDPVLQVAAESRKKLVTHRRRTAKAQKNTQKTAKR